jgi:hypothetical protein
LSAPAPSLQTLAFGALTTLVFLTTGLLYFRATERTFADLI